jgi:hypothetical protein
MAFRVQRNRYEYIYLRPTNARADDQVRRNHSTQYGAHPEFDFDRLRKESPEKYESYVDLEPGVAQPCLIVNDLQLGDSEGAVALWVGARHGRVLRESKITQ